MKPPLPHHNGTIYLCEPSVATGRLAWALARCRDQRLRMTKARECILRYLAGHSAPVSLEILTRAEEFHLRCDPATIYRTLMLLKELEVVRQVSLPHKTSYFALNAPDDNGAYLICRRCGAVAELPLPKSVMQAVEEAANAQEFFWLHPELDCYGLCRDCQAAKQKETPTNKLRVSG